MKCVYRGTVFSKLPQDHFFWILDYKRKLSLLGFLTLALMLIVSRMHLHFCWVTRDGAGLEDKYVGDSLLTGMNELLFHGTPFLLERPANYCVCASFQCHINYYQLKSVKQHFIISQFCRWSSAGPSDLGLTLKELVRLLSSLRVLGKNPFWCSIRFLVKSNSVVLGLRFPPSCRLTEGPLGAARGHAHFPALWPFHRQCNGASPNSNHSHTQNLCSGKAPCKGSFD